MGNTLSQQVTGHGGSRAVPLHSLAHGPYLPLPRDTESCKIFASTGVQQPEDDTHPRKVLPRKWCHSYAGSPQSLTTLVTGASESVISPVDPMGMALLLHLF